MADTPTQPTEAPAKPKIEPCSRCDGSRASQVHVSYYTEEGDPLCEPCWTAEYGDMELIDD